MKNVVLYLKRLTSLKENEYWAKNLLRMRIFQNTILILEHMKLSFDVFQFFYEYVILLPIFNPHDFFSLIVFCSSMSFVNNKATRDDNEKLSNALKNRFLASLVLRKIHMSVRIKKFSSHNSGIYSDIFSQFIDSRCNSLWLMRNTKTLQVGLMDWIKNYHNAHELIWFFFKLSPWSIGF